MRKYHKLLVVITLWIIYISCSIGILGFLIHNHTAISILHASSDLKTIFLQNIMTNVFPLTMLIGFFIYFKKNAPVKLGLDISTPLGKYLSCGLAAILLGCYVFLLFTKEDVLTITYGLFYYVFLIAFLEEFMYRGIFLYLLEGQPKTILWMLPNLLFAFSHFWMLIGFGAFEPKDIIHFLLTNVLGYLIAGMVFQKLKDFSNTLWVPILLHAILDYTGMFNL